MTYEDRVSKAISNLLDIEQRSFGGKIGLISSIDVEISDDLFTELVYAVDELSWSPDDQGKKHAVHLIALTWEHASVSQRGSLRALFVTALSRLGVSPSSAMLEYELSEDSRLSALGSYGAQLAAALMQYEYFEVIGDKGYYLSSFQKEVLDSIKESKVVGISAPTSAGKSYAIYLAIVRHALISKKKVIYLVPTISLINQVSADIRSILESHDLYEWKVFTSLQDGSDCCVHVLTQERALYGSEIYEISDVGMIIVDEVQNLERIDDEKDIRSKVLFDTLRELKGSSFDARIVLSGPRVRDIGNLGSSVFEMPGAEVVTNRSPVASITYAISSRRNGVYLTQYSAFSSQGRSVRIDRPDLVKGLGQTRYTPDFLGYLYGLINSLGDESRNIIFSPTSEQARKTATYIVGRSSRVTNVRAAKRNELARYLADSIHPAYELVECVRHGIAFHSGKVPPHARLVTELAYLEGTIKDLVCTTSLMQGVNLPANLVLVRNPQLFIQRRAGSEGVLSPYEFANLRGRAGRLMKDFVGRTLVLDEDSFVASEEQGELFPEAEKSISPGYKDLLARNREAVEGELLRSGSAGLSGKFLATHIRQTVLRHGEGSGDILSRVGLDIDPSLLKEVRRQLQTLDVARDVCIANRYWDPFDLQAIQDNISGGVVDELPEGPWSIDSSVLERLINFQVSVSPYYAQRYLGDSSEKQIRSWAISAIEWARERPLHEIIKNRRFSDDVSSKIDGQISDIQKYVVYGIPALLKPIADIRGAGHGLLASIEAGVFSPASRILTERGIYRETAIHLRRKVFPQVSGEGEALKRAVFGEVAKSLGSLDYWVERQLSPIMGQWSREVANG